MIKLDSVSIKNFRGIKDLSLNIGQRSFAICGPNGTGKSGIVDAIEFALTGNITRLTGRGAGGLSVKSHAPHVDLRDDPAKASVTVSAYSTILGKTFTIERSVSKPKQAVVRPDAPDIQALVKELEQHPELALSRREILKYIIAEPGSRSEEVQSLLKLEDVGNLRKTLTSLVNSIKREVASADDSLANTRTQLLSGLEIDDAKAVLILAAVNRRRALLSAEPLTALEKGTNLKAGIDLSGRNSSKPSVSKAAANSDIESFRRRSHFFESPEILESLIRIGTVLDRLEGDPVLLRDLHHNSLLQKGLDLLESNECPLCGTHWDIENLRERLKQRLDKALIASNLQAELRRDAEPIRQAILSLSSLSDLVAGYARELLPERSFVALAVWKDSLILLEECLATTNFQGIRDSLTKEKLSLPLPAEEEIASLEQVVAAIPDSTERDAALQFLFVAQERFENYSRSKAIAVKAKASVHVAGKIADTYARISDRVLTDLYEEVEQDFSRYYSLIHHEDEGSFSARLTPSIGKLGFAVNFYGRGNFPPGAYHSEGHQDSMGLCLYLALMKKTMGANFTLAILDDVLMSVDAGHRKDVVRLLKSEFPKTQFILTTHDQVWLNHMTNEGLVMRGASLQIRRWTVDEGPLVWSSKDVWADIEKDLADNDVVAASALLRNHLERVVSTLADRLRAQAEYRKDGTYDLGDLLGPVVGRWKELLKRAKAAANSWNKRSEVECLEEMERRFTTLYLVTGIDNWEMNKALHYNEWVNLQRQDFAPLVKAYQDFLACFECINCKTLLYVSPKKGAVKSLQCDCNSYSLISASSPKAKDKSPGSVAKEKDKLPTDQRNLF